jgi:hypothetical protein
VAFLPIPKNARDIGACIYCGSTDGQLQREHAVPYGLNGRWTLLRASCAACAAITHRFERDTLKSLWPVPRTVLAMSSRRGSHPATLPLVIEKGGTLRTIQIARDQYPAYLPVPMFPPPGYVAGRPSFSAANTQIRFLHIAGPSFEDIAKLHAADFVGARLNFAPEEFARTLAKIAFCIGVYVLGLAPLRNAPILPIILGADRDFGRWVGQWTGEEVNKPHSLHAAEVRASGTDIHVILRFFAQFGAPEYHVVLGPADPAFAGSGAWPWKD